jgi:hypothetical protein
MAQAFSFTLVARSASNANAIQKLLEGSNKHMKEGEPLLQQLYQKEAADRVERCLRAASALAGPVQPCDIGKALDITKARASFCKLLKLLDQYLKWLLSGLPYQLVPGASPFTACKPHSSRTSSSRRGLLQPTEDQSAQMPSSGLNVGLKYLQHLLQAAVAAQQDTVDAVGAVLMTPDSGELPALS